MPRYYAAAIQTAFDCPADRSAIPSRIRRMLAMADGALVGYEPFHDLRLFVFPEFAHAVPIKLTVGELLETYAVEVSDIAPAYEAFCRARGCFIQTGTFIERDPAWSGHAFNTTLLIGPTGVLSRYRKVNPWIPWEVHTSPHDLLPQGYGDPLFPVTHTEIGALGCAICYDWLFPEPLREMAFAGAEVLIRVSAYMDPWGATPPMDWWTLMNRARAVENTAFVVAANQGAHLKEYPPFSWPGASMAVDFDGRILAQADPGEGERVVIAPIDIDALRAERARRRGHDMRGHHRTGAYSYGAARAGAAAEAFAPAPSGTPITIESNNARIAEAKARLDVRRGAVDKGAIITSVIAIVLALGMLWLLQRTPPVPVRSAEVTSALDRGAALMGQFDFRGAAAAFGEASAADPADGLAQLNLAIATLNETEEDSQTRANALLAPLSLLAPELAGGGAPADLEIAIRATYCLALAQLFLGEPESAQRALAMVTAHRPDDAFAQFYLAQSMEMQGEAAAARPHYAKALELDPMLRSAALALSRCAMQAGDTPEGERFLALFESLDRNPRAHLAEFKYTRMGPLAMVLLPREPVVATLPPGDPFAAPLAVSVAGGSVGSQPVTAWSSIATCVDLDGNAWTDALLTTPRAARSSGDGSSEDALILLSNESSRSLADASHAATSALRGLRGILAVGDIDGDARAEIVSASEGAFKVARRDESWHWMVTAGLDGAQWPSGADGERTAANDLKLLDLDGDADLDLLLTDEAGLHVSINKGDGSFVSLWEMLGAEPPTAGDSQPVADGLLWSQTWSQVRALSILPWDADNDGDTDLILSGHLGPSELWLNEGLWRWTRDATWSWRQVRGVAVDPATGDSLIVECFPFMPGASVTVRSVRDGAVRLHSPRGAQDVAVYDITGRGEPAFIVDFQYGEDAVEVWSLDGSILQRLERVDLLGVLVDQDDRGPSLLLRDITSGSIMVAGPGPGRLPFASFTLSGRTDPSQSMRSNASGVGTAWSMRLGGTWAQGSALPHTSAPGQSLQPEVCGLAGRASADFIRLEWPDALYQTELEIKPGHTTLVETQRQVSSCPVIFGWNGSEFEFVTDCLGVGGLGYLTTVERGANGGLRPVYAPPTPRESVLIPESVLHERNGALELRLGEPMEESCFVDAARLIAYDLPMGWQMAPDERLAILGPGATGEAVFWRESNAARVAHATVCGAPSDASAQSDASDALSVADGRAASGPPQHPHFIGLLQQPLVLEVQFDRPLTALTGAPTLVMDGWVEYPYCQTNLAMWQAGVAPAAPTFEVLNPATGKWVTLQAEYGYPAGMPRRALFPLSGLQGELPRECNTLRITTTVEMFVDALMVVGAEPCPEAARHECVLLDAEVAVCGFPQRTTLAQKRPHYDYSRRAPLWDTRSQRGGLTEIGSCIPLIASTDDAVAIFGPGEEIRLRWGVPEVSRDDGAQTTRAWILELNGWCKDMDRYTGDGATIGPLPTRNGAAPSEHALSLMREFNTRR